MQEPSATVLQCVSVCKHISKSAVIPDWIPVTDFYFDEHEPTSSFDFLLRNLTLIHLIDFTCSRLNEHFLVYVDLLNQSLLGLRKTPQPSQKSSVTSVCRLLVYMMLKLLNVSVCRSNVNNVWCGHVNILDSSRMMCFLFQNSPKLNCTVSYKTYVCFTFTDITGSTSCSLTATCKTDSTKTIFINRVSVAGLVYTDYKKVFAPFLIVTTLILYI